MADNIHYNDVTPTTTAPAGSLAEQVVNGTHPVIQDTKADFNGLACSAKTGRTENDVQPMSHFHSLFYDLFTWKFPKATGFFFVASIFTIILFHYVNVLRYVFKASYMLFAVAAGVEIAGKPFGMNGVVSSFRPSRYYTIPRESLENLFQQLHDLVNFFAVEFQRVVFVENIFATTSAFVASYFGYILIKYIPLWTLLMLSTTTAFTAPLFYISNKEVIDEQIRNASEIAHAQFESLKKLVGQYYDETAVRAKATAAELQTKVQGYTSKTHIKTEASSTSAARDFLNGPKNLTADHEYPKVPTTVPTKEPAVDEPILA